jgi:GT2 family glycosyltransferase
MSEQGSASGHGAPSVVEERPARHGDDAPPPVRVLAIELSEGVPAVPDDGGPNAHRYGAAKVLVRLHDQLIGVLDIELPHGGLDAPAHTAAITTEFAGAINQHLASDGLAPLDRSAPHPLEIGSHCSSHRPLANAAPFVSVVVPTTGRNPKLVPNLESLAALDYPNFEVVVVDNAPHTDTVARVVAECTALRARVRYTAEHRPGVTYARNRGLAEAKGQIVAYADDDVLVDSNWLRTLVDGFTGDDVMAVTGQVLAGELETPAQVWIEEYGGFGKGNARRKFDKDGFDVIADGQVERVASTPGSIYPYLPGTYGTGANMAFRTEALRELGGFDHRLRTGEDIDVLMRVVLAGHVLVYEPAAIVWHSHHRDIAALRRTMFQYGVGLSAVIFKCLATDAAGRRALLRRLPSGVAHAIKPHSSKNNKKQGSYPAVLTMLELCGMVLGPVYFTAAAWSKRSERKDA